MAHLQWVFPLNMVIFNSYVKLPEGKWCLFLGYGSKNDKKNAIKNPPSSKTIGPLTRVDVWKAIQLLSWRVEFKKGLRYGFGAWVVFCLPQKPPPQSTAFFHGTGVFSFFSTTAVLGYLSFPPINLTFQQQIIDFWMSIPNLQWGWLSSHIFF